MKRDEPEQQVNQPGPAKAAVSTNNRPINKREQERKEKKLQTKKGEKGGGRRNEMAPPLTSHHLA